MSETESSARRGVRDRPIRQVEVDGDLATPGIHGDRVGRDESDDVREQPVFHGLDAVTQARLVVLGQDRDTLLRDDRAAVERCIDDVDRHARQTHAMLEGVADRGRAGERRQQRRMRVQDPVREGGQHARTDDPHVPGEHDQVRSRPGERFRQGVVIAAGDQCGVDALLAGPLERRACPVREDQDDRATELATLRCGVQCPQVGAGAGHADRDPRRSGRPTLVAHATDSSGPSA